MDQKGKEEKVSHIIKMELVFGCHGQHKEIDRQHSHVSVLNTELKPISVA